MNLLTKSSKKTSSLMRSSNMEMFMMMLNMKMLKILHKDSWIEILYQHFDIDINDEDLVGCYLSYD
jgi:hypothetical protein